MNDQYRAVLFSKQAEDPVSAMLRASGLEPVSPLDENHDRKPPVLLVINHLIRKTVEICQNLRSAPSFHETPILALLDYSEINSPQLKQLDDLRVDCVPRTITPEAMKNFVRERVLNPLLESKTEPSVQAPPKKPEEPKPKPPAQTPPPSAAPIRKPTPPPENKAEKRSPPVKLKAQASDSPTPTSPPAAALRQAEKVAKPTQPATQFPRETKKELVEEINISKIPLPSNLLRAIPENREIFKNEHKCEHCRRWTVRREDMFCARCGKELAQLRLRTESPIRFTRSNGNDRCLTALVELENPRQNPVCLQFNITTDDRSFAERLKFRPKNAELETGNRTLQLLMDTLGLDPNQDHNAELQIIANLPGADSRFLIQRVELLMEGRPKLDAVLPDEHCNYVAGTENKGRVKIVNEGHGGLVLKRLSLDGESLSFESPGRIANSTPQTVTFILPKLDNLPVGMHSKKLVCEAEGQPPKELTLKINATHPARLVTLPEELNLGTKSVLRHHPMTLELRNTGGEDLTVETIETPDWLDCRPRKLKIPPQATRTVDLLLKGTVVPDSLIVARKSLETEIRIHCNSNNSPVHIVPVHVNFIRPERYSSFIGIDFGTTGSCVAVLNRNRRKEEETVALDGDQKIMPTVLYFKHSDFILSGHEAQQAATTDPESSVTAIKRVLGQKEKRTIKGKEFDPTELTAEVIKELLRKTEAALIEMEIEYSPSLAVVTRPVEFSQDRQQALIDACRKAGLDVENSGSNYIISEAHAVALCYLSRKRALNDQQPPAERSESDVERVLVFDFGGGSLDCELVEITAADGLMVTSAQYGDDHLGGEDIDWELVRLLKNKIRERHPDFDANSLEEDETKIRRLYRDPRLLDVVMGIRQNFKRTAEEAKIQLSAAESVEIEVGPILRTGATAINPYLEDGVRFKFTITRQDLERAMKDILFRAAEIVQAICAQAGVAPEKIQTILHAGRTSNLPQIKEMIKNLLPAAMDRSSLIPPKECVALGATFWGKIKGDPDSAYTIISNVSQLGYGVGRLKFERQTTRHLFDLLIPAQTMLPFEKKFVFPLKDGSITLRLAKNRGHRNTVEDNHGLFQFDPVMLKFDGLNQTEVEVIFRIDTSHILEVYAEHNQQSHKIPLNQD